MPKATFKQIDLLRKRRDTEFLAEPYFIDTKKYIKKGISSGLILFMVSIIVGIPFIFRTKFLESKKEQIKIFSDEYDLIERKLNKEQRQLNLISEFNIQLKNSIYNINSSSALFQEIALIIPKDIQILDLKSNGNSLVMKVKVFNSDYLQALNSFLLNLEESELVRFDNIDLKSIKIASRNSKDDGYLVDIDTRLSTKYRDINQKYLIKLGSHGLFNRLNILKNLDISHDD